MTKRTLTLALLGAVAFAFAVAPALAKPGDGHDGQASERKAAAREHREEMKERFHAVCDDPENETVEERCEKARHVGEMAFKARRAAHALLMAIHATEKRIERLEDKEAALNASIQSGELSPENQTKAEHRLEVVQHQLEKARERLEKLQERLEKLHAKWAEVREHVAERRAKHMDDEDESASPTPSPSPST